MPCAGPTRCRIPSTMANTIAPPTAPHKTGLIFSQSIRHLPSMQAWKTFGQRPAAVTNPVVRVCFCDGPFFKNAAMTVATATTNSAAIRFRRYVGLCPCLFRGTSFDQKKTLVVHRVVSLSHPLDHSVAHIRIKRHITFVPYRRALRSGLPVRVFYLSCCADSPGIAVYY